MVSLGIQATPTPAATAKPLFGRAVELEQLRTLLFDARAGHGSVVLLAGAAGIGKTHLTDALAGVAQQFEMQVMWGRCREDPGAPAYWPWQQLLRNHVPDREARDLADLPELASLVPELFGSDLPAPTPGEPHNPDQKRFRLFSAIAALFGGLAQRRPLLLIFDDLHRADKPSLRLLEFVAAELSACAALIVGAYRDSDVSSGHRFQSTLSELARLHRYHSLRLGNLDRASVRKLVGQEIGEPAESTLIEEIYRRTEGHPLYLVETVRHLRQGGPSDRLPASLRAIINQRFSELPSNTVQSLNAAAVMGRRFDLDTLNQLIDGDIAAVLRALEPALSGHQIETLPAPGHFQFSHALIREALYDSLSASERLHIHRSLAEILEKRGADLAQTAYHYYQAAPLGVAGKAAFFAELAAREAEQMMAYEEAARYYRLALNTADESKTASLSLALGNAQLRAGESLQAVLMFEKAAELAERDGNSSMLVQAAIGLEEALWRPGLPGDKAVVRLQKALRDTPEVDSEQRIRLMCALVRAYMMSGDDGRARSLQQQAEAIARELSAPVLLARTLLAGMYASQLASQHPNLLSERLAKAAESKRLAKQAGDTSLYHEILIWSIHNLLIAGEISSLEATLDEQQQLARSQKQPFYKYFELLLKVVLALSRGAFQVAEVRAAEALALCRWLPGHDGEGIYGIQMFCIRREQGRLRELAPAVEHFVNTTNDSAVWQPGLALVYAELGAKAKAAELFYRLAENDFASLPRDGLWVTCLGYAAEVCAFLDAKPQASTLYRLLLSHQGLNIVIGANIGCLGAADRFLGMLAATRDDWPVADAHFRRALAVDEKQGFSVWAAHTRYQYAAMLARRRSEGDRQRAQEYLDEALETATKLGMPTLAQRIVELRQRVRSVPGDRPVGAGLSKREVEVIRLIAAGNNNKEIGRTLFISTNTVAAHVRNILEKTHTGNRTEAAAFAADHGLLPARVRDSQAE